jgi:cold shock CspA family protein
VDVEEALAGALVQALAGALVGSVGGQDGMVGVLSHDKGSYGFITLLTPLEDGETSMFVMPAQCESFGGVFPPIGTEVAFEVVLDDKTGRRRAQNVRLSGTFQNFLGTKGGKAQGKGGMPGKAAGKACGKAAGKAEPFGKGVPGKGLSKGDQKGVTTMRGILTHDKGKFGFVTLEDGVTTLFAMPLNCSGFGGAFPAVGTEVMFEVVPDSKTGKPRAENMRPRFTLGVMTHDKGQYGFITMQDGSTMFAMPLNCEAFGGAFPPIGTEVMFDTVADLKTGRPRAENIGPADANRVGYAAKPIAHAPLQAMGSPGAKTMAGVMTQDNGQKGFTTLEAGALEGETLAGVMTHDKGQYGFITLEDGETTLFVMPLNCDAFGKAFPPIGTALMFEVTSDSKSGRPRASNVRPLGEVPVTVQGARPRSRSPRRTAPVQPTLTAMLA